VKKSRKGAQIERISWEGIDNFWFDEWE